MCAIKQNSCQYNRPSSTVGRHITVDFHWSRRAVWMSHVDRVDAICYLTAVDENLVTVIACSGTNSVLVGHMHYGIIDQVSLRLEASQET